jgi:alkaline phosphatase
MNTLPSILCILLILPIYGFAEGNVIFIHPDGTGLGHWTAGRLIKAGPDGNLNWDRLERLATYRPHQQNWLSTTSQAGGTVHAYGKKVHHDSYGMNRNQPLTSASGKPHSIMTEAMHAGIRCGIVNTGHITEPGTGVFLASSVNRGNRTELAKKIIMSGAEVIFAGGENLMIPEGETGVHGGTGMRTDGVNLLDLARELGYTVIFTREELLKLPPDAGRVLGVFAAWATFNFDTEEALADAGLPTYDPEAPTVAEMTAKAIELLSSDPDRHFFLMVEEEGTDNFSNVGNARGMLDAVLRADDAIGKALAFLERQPERNTLLLVGADSDAGSPSIVAPRNASPDAPLPERTHTGADLDGQEGTGTRPFLSQPDALGQRHPFGIAWPYRHDMPTGCVTRAHGYRSELLGSGVDNTDLFTIMHTVLFTPGPTLTP